VWVRHELGRGAIDGSKAHEEVAIRGVHPDVGAEDDIRMAFSLHTSFAAPSPKTASVERFLKV
jgi:hypothetical protein